MKGNIGIPMIMEKIESCNKKFNNLTKKQKESIKYNYFCDLMPIKKIAKIYNTGYKDVYDVIKKCDKEKYSHRSNDDFNKTIVVERKSDIINTYNYLMSLERTPKEKVLNKMLGKLNYEQRKEVREHFDSINKKFRNNKKENK